MEGTQCLPWAFRTLALGETTSNVRSSFTLRWTWCEEAPNSHLNGSHIKGTPEGEKKGGERLTSQFPALVQIISAEKSVRWDTKPTWMSSPVEPSVNSSLSHLITVLLEKHQERPPSETR